MTGVSPDTPPPSPADVIGAALARVWQDEDKDCGTEAAVSRVTVNGREYDGATMVGLALPGDGPLHREGQRYRSRCDPHVRIGFLAPLADVRLPLSFCRRCFPTGGTP